MSEARCWRHITSKKPSHLSPKVTPFGDIYSRLGLDIRSREITTIAALTAMGNVEPRLQVHIHSGLNVGLNRNEVVETFMQVGLDGVGALGGWRAR